MCQVGRIVIHSPLRSHPVKRPFLGQDYRAGEQNEETHQQHLRVRHYRKGVDNFLDDAYQTTQRGRLICQTVDVANLVRWVGVAGAVKVGAAKAGKHTVFIEELTIHVRVGFHLLGRKVRWGADRGPK
jgi:hypothetical protein